ncbi:MAG: hypothetical protein AB8G05_19700 [Oligoflexales bacterium]
MWKILITLGISLLFSCGGDDSKSNISISFDPIRFCTQAGVDGLCSTSRSQISQGTTRIYSSTQVNFNTTAGSFNFNWYLVNESGCRTKLSTDSVVPQVDGQQTLTGYYMNTGGLTKGLYELEIVFNSSDTSESALAQFSVN